MRGYPSNRVARRPSQPPRATAVAGGAPNPKKIWDIFTGWGCETSLPDVCDRLEKLSLDALAAEDCKAKRGARA